MKNLTIKFDVSIREAMKALNKTGEKCLVVVNNDKKLLGTLTDGDIRRSILNGADFNKSIKNTFNPNPISLIKDMFSKEKARQLMTTHEINAVAVHLPWLVCINGHILAEGPPSEVITTEMLRLTYGAEMPVNQ